MKRHHGLTDPVTRSIIQPTGVDPRKAKTLEEASANGDGTYNGARALSWLSEVLSPGKGMTEDEVAREFQSAVAARRSKDGA